MKIVWDGLKRLANIAKPGLDFAEIDPTFFLTAAIAGEALSIISLRRVSIRERGRL